jgi:1-acyl-sn-glycerol-3-phosphate acyltransferase
MGQQREPLISLLLYRLFKWSVVYPSFHFGFKGRVLGLDQMPMSGPVIVVCNHASDFDPPFVASGMGRPLAYMAKQELFQIPILGRLIRWYGAYPVKRGSGDRAAIRAALQSLEEGWAVGVFLDGTRTEDGLIHQPKLGAAMIAKQAQAPLLPVCIWGTHRVLPKGRSRPQLVPVTIRVGAPIAPPSPKGDRAELQAVTEQCQRIINDLHALGR